MTTMPTLPPVTGVTPYLSIDATAAIPFYVEAFGAEVLARMPAQDGKRVMHGHLRINGGTLLLADTFPEHGHPQQTPGAFTLHLQVDDADTWYARAVAAGCTPTMPVELMFWGDRYGQVRDPFGVMWSIGGPNKS
ncbi:MAG: glyoxalase/bleomycin resistance/extradiol dioxygenase family protein [Kofleriaceae bacterium]